MTDTNQKKDSSSEIINKIKCTTNNVIVNGNNTGDVNIGNNGQVPIAEEGYLGTYSSGDDGYDNKKNNKGFTCIIENNNIINKVVAGGGQPPIPPVNVTCEECFAQVLNATAFANLELDLEMGGIDVFVGATEVEINSLAELCDILENESGTILVSVVTQILSNQEITLTSGEFLELVTCIGTALGITIPPILGPIMR
ncbi:MAG TPA: hypothetical protein VFZ46_03375 [Nitrososphaeraceae archaeon]